MNKKLIALAVSGALCAPIMVAQADDSGPTVYGRLNVGIGYIDDDIAGVETDDTLDVQDVSSRFGNPWRRRPG